MTSGTSSLPNVRGSIHEVLFAQRLADNEKKVRDRALKKLKVFLSLKSSNGPGFTDDDALKIWKGLFYCMYMADKPLVQEDVAEEIAYLIHDLGNQSDRHTFVSAAFRTFAREWNGIDTFRLDKFMMFMRRVLRHVFVYLKLQQWNLKEVVRYMNILDANVIRADDHTNSTPLGIKLHLSSIIMEELAKIGGEELDNKVILAVIKPFLKVLAVSKLEIYRTTVAEEIIRHLMRQTDIGVEAEENMDITMKSEKKRGNKMLKKAVGDDDAGVDVIAEGDDNDDDVEMEERTLEDVVLDPRAGSVDVFIPQLKPDFEFIANALQDVGSLKNVSKVNRHLLYKLVGECRDMAGNVFPLGFPEEQLDDGEEEKMVENEGKAVEDLQEFYSQLKEVKATNVKEMEDLKPDPLKNFLVEESFADKKRRKRKQKLKRLEKKPVPLTKKKAFSKQLVAAEENRVKAVERKLSLITQEIGLPNITNMPLKRKSMEMASDTAKPLKRKKKSSETNAKVQKKIKKNKSAGFEVSAITPNSLEGKSKLSSSLGFEVTPICSKEQSGMKQNHLPKVEKVAEKIQDICESTLSLATVSTLPGKPEVMVSDQPKKIKKKKKKVKAEGFKESSSTISKISQGNLSKKEKETVTKRSKEVVSSAASETYGDTLILSKGNVSIASKGVSQSNVESVEKTISKTAVVEGKSEQKSEKVVSQEVSERKTKAKKKKNKGKVDMKSNAVKIDMKSNQVNTSSKESEKKHLKAVENSIVASPVNAQNTTAVGKSPKKTPSKAKGLTMNFSGDENGSLYKRSLKEDIEIFIKNRRNMKLEKRKSGAAFNSPKGTPKTPKTKERTIKINLKQNQEHDFKDYEHSVRNSPQIPYSADRLPKAPVLKPSPSPILVGRPALKILKNVIRKSPGAKSASPLLKNKSPKARKMNRSRASDFF